MIDRSKVGMVLPPVRMRVEMGLLKLFAEATGQTDPLYIDPAAAAAAGYRGLVAPPTYASCLYMMGRLDPMGTYRALGVRVERVLHAEQRFDLHAPICAGDDLEFETKVVDIYDKKGGSLEFLVQEMKAVNQLCEHVATAVQTIVVRN